MDSALDPLDLVKYSARREKASPKTINIEALAEYLEEIVQEVANLINKDPKKEFLYKNPNGWEGKHGKPVKKSLQKKVITTPIKHQLRITNDSNQPISGGSSESFVTPSPSTSSEDFEFELERWSLIQDFEFHLLVHQINEFIQTWQLTPATKFVLIALDKMECCPPFGERYFVEAHFSKPTPKCPNPLAVARVYFHINVSHLLPSNYPVNVIYKFEGYKSQFYAMGEHKMSSNKFQRYFIDSILHMKLAFYTELCKCCNPLKTLEKCKNNSKLDRMYNW